MISILFDCPLNECSYPRSLALIIASVVWFLISCPPPTFLSSIDRNRSAKMTSATNEVGKAADDRGGYSDLLFGMTGGEATVQSSPSSASSSLSLSIGCSPTQLGKRGRSGSEERAKWSMCEVESRRVCRDSYDGGIDLAFGLPNTVDGGPPATEKRSTEAGSIERTETARREDPSVAWCSETSDMGHCVKRPRINRHDENDQSLVQEMSMESGDYDESDERKTNGDSDEVIVLDGQTFGHHQNADLDQVMEHSGGSCYNRWRASAEESVAETARNMESQGTAIQTGASNPSKTLSFSNTYIGSNAISLRFSDRGGGEIGQLDLEPTDMVMHDLAGIEERASECDIEYRSGLDQEFMSNSSRSLVEATEPQEQQMQPDLWHAGDEQVIPEYCQYLKGSESDAMTLPELTEDEHSLESMSDIYVTTGKPSFPGLGGQLH